MTTQRRSDVEGERGQPAPDRFQPAPKHSRQSDDPEEPDALDVMAHNKPQTAGRSGSSERSYREMRAFARDDEEDLQGEEDLAKQLRQADESDSDSR